LCPGITTNKHKETTVQFFDNLIARIAAATSYYWERITTNMPLRMKVGKFGIWLMEIGRDLQVHYANWNSEFRLKVTYVPNPDMCNVHVSEEVTSEAIVTFESLHFQKDKQTPLVLALFAVKGVRRVTLHRYEIGITKGVVFSWEELLPTIETVILEHLTVKKD
jgi:hypothetical protein